MNIKIQKEIKDLALKARPKEICGFIYTSDKDIFIYPCKNISEEPEEAFEIEHDEYFSCARQASSIGGEIVGIYHSGKDAAFSPSDIFHADEWPIPLYLYSFNEDVFKTYVPGKYVVDYIGRPFIWGQYDCYTLVKDFYRREYKLYLNDYDCDESFESIVRNDIVLNFSKEGFLQSSDMSNIKDGDVLLFLCGKNYHVGVYVGSNRFLHQPLKGQSRIEAIDGFWAKNLKFILKHKTRL